MSNRIEKDSLGEVPVPTNALYGAQTQRAVDNFPISGIRFPRRFLWALGLVKRSCAQANHDLGLLDAERANTEASINLVLAIGEHNRSQFNLRQLTGGKPQR